MEELIFRERARKRALPRVRWTLLLLAAALLAAALLRPGLAVTVGGETLGVYDPRELARRLDAAEAAAGELLGETVDLRAGVTLRLCLSPGGWSRDYRRLERALLEQAPGVARLWVVKAGDEPLGVVDDPSVLGELVAVLVGQYAGPYTVSAELEPALTLTRSYARAADALPAEELSARLRELVRVRTQECAADALPAAENGIVTD